MEFFWASRLKMGKYYYPKLKLNAYKVEVLKNMWLFHRVVTTAVSQRPCLNLHNNELLKFIKLKHENPSVVVYCHQNKMYIPKRRAFLLSTTLYTSLVFMQSVETCI